VNPWLSTTGAMGSNLYIQIPIIDFEKELVKSAFTYVDIISELMSTYFLCSHIPNGWKNTYLYKSVG